MANDTYVQSSDQGAFPGVLAYLATAALVLLFMMAFGLMLRLEHAQFTDIGPLWFYKLMTLHGIGMVGIVGMAGAAVMWHFLSQYVALSKRVLWFNFSAFLLGVALILTSVFLGNFHGGWTFLYPLPSTSMGTWSTNAAAAFLCGILIIGLGFLVLHLDIARAVTVRYGGLGAGLGWPQLFGTDDGNAPPPAVVASTMTTVVNLAALVAAAAILVMMLINLFLPEFSIDPRLAKALIYFFGHVFINSVIYMAVIAVYEILPRYTRRPWKSNKVFLASWTASTLMVLFIFPHHLLMDFIFPKWLLITGHVIGYLNTFPILVVTGYGALMIVYRSGIQWDMSIRLLFVSLLGWAAGAMPAFIDGTIPVNYVMHNTLWVPGHFHTYLLLGMLSMVFGFMYYLGKPDHDAPDPLLDVLAYWTYVVGTLGFTLSFLYGGKISTPRRYAVHFAEWIAVDRLSVFFAVLVIAAVGVFLARFFMRLGHMRHNRVRAPSIYEPSHA